MGINGSKPDNGTAVKVNKTYYVLRVEDQGPIEHACGIEGCPFRAVLTDGAKFECSVHAKQNLRMRDKRWEWCDGKETLNCGYVCGRDSALMFWSDRSNQFHFVCVECLQKERPDVAAELLAALPTANEYKRKTRV